MPQDSPNSKTQKQRVRTFVFFARHGAHALLGVPQKTMMHTTLILYKNGGWWEERKVMSSKDIESIKGNGIKCIEN